MSALVIFSLTYLGIALGKIPGLALDRVGLALLGAIAMIVSGTVTPGDAAHSIDLATILLLYSLMIISAQLRLGGFYSWLAAKITVFLSRPGLFLFVLMMVAAFLSALLANDIVCFAFTPVLALALIDVRMNPLPFLIGLAVSSNIGSAATIIGNPQNMLIGQVGHLDFGKFIFHCAPPSIMALVAAYAFIWLMYRKKFFIRERRFPEKPLDAWPTFNPWQTAKGICSVFILIVLFFSPIPREISAIAIAGILLCSRKMKTRDILGLVDWHLITLFCALFIIIEGISQGEMLSNAVYRMAENGVDLRRLWVLTGVSTILSNMVSNVPGVMLLVKFLDPHAPAQWYTLALSSTFAGNLFLLGSIANLIVVEQAAHFGIRISFRDHAVIGVPVTAISLLILIAWI
jgi:Na+/H+ antiporter NhaD/arsenite permease-like protein